MFDPKGEWIPEKLQGYRRRGDSYELITDSRSEVLQLRLVVEKKLIGFYREDNGEKLLTVDEIASALKVLIQKRLEAEAQVEKKCQRAGTERQRADAESQRADTERPRRVAELESLLARYRSHFGELPQDNG